VFAKNQWPCALRQSLEVCRKGSQRHSDGLIRFEKRLEMTDSDCSAKVRKELLQLVQQFAHYSHERLAAQNGGVDLASQRIARIREIIERLNRSLGLPNDPVP